MDMDRGDAYELGEVGMFEGRGGGLRFVLYFTSTMETTRISRLRKFCWVFPSCISFFYRLKAGSRDVCLWTILFVRWVDWSGIVPYYESSIVLQQPRVWVYTVCLGGTGCTEMLRNSIWQRDITYGQLDATVRPWGSHSSRRQLKCSAEIKCMNASYHVNNRTPFFVSWMRSI